MDGLLPRADASLSPQRHSHIPATLPVLFHVTPCVREADNYACRSIRVNLSICSLSLPVLSASFFLGRLFFVCPPYSVTGRQGLVSSRVSRSRMCRHDDGGSEKKTESEQRAATALLDSCARLQTSLLNRQPAAGVVAVSAATAGSAAAAATAAVTCHQPTFPFTCPCQHHKSYAQ